MIREQICQTYGPRKTSYYKEIPAKVKSRPKSHSRNKSDTETGGRFDTQNSSQKRSIIRDEAFSPDEEAGRKQNISLSPS